MNEKTVNKPVAICYVCPSCARVLTVYVQVPKPPCCTRCGKVMRPGAKDAMPGQMALFTEQQAPRRKSR